MTTSTDAMLDHLLGGGLRTKEGGVETDRHHLGVLILGDVGHRPTRLHAGAVDHDAQPTKSLCCRVDEAD